MQGRKKAMRDQCICNRDRSRSANEHCCITYARVCVPISPHFSRVTYIHNRLHDLKRTFDSENTCLSIVGEMCFRNNDAPSNRATIKIVHIHRDILKFFRFMYTYIYIYLKKYAIYIFLLAENFSSSTYKLLLITSIFSKFMNQERRGAIFVHPSLEKLRVCNIYEKIYKLFPARGVARETFLTGSRIGAASVAHKCNIPSCTITSESYGNDQMGRTSIRRGNCPSDCCYAIRLPGR